MVLEDIEVRRENFFTLLLILKINWLVLKISHFSQFSEFTPEHTSDNGILRGKHFFIRGGDYSIEFKPLIQY